MNKESIGGVVDDEIDLREIWRILVSGKKWLIASVLLCVGLALAYVLTAQEYFKGKVYLLPPRIEDIAELNKASQLMELNAINEAQLQTNQTSAEITTIKVYKTLSDYLSSRAYKKKFFEANVIFEMAISKANRGRVFNEYFLPKINIKEVKSDEKNAIKFTSLVVSLELPNQEKIAYLTNKYVKEALVDVSGILSGDVDYLVKKKINNVKQIIDSKIKIAQDERRDKATRLQTELRISKKLNINRPVNSELVIITNNTTYRPLSFYTGTIALKQKIDELGNEKNLMSFMSGLRPLQDQLRTLQNIQINPDLVKVARVDAWAYSPLKSIKPKKILILAVALVLGLFLGIFVVFFKNVLTKERIA